MIEKGESQSVEFKQSWRDGYLKTIAAFANTDGGTLFIGIDDKGKVVGIENIKDLLNLLPNKINSRLGIVADILGLSKNRKAYIKIEVAKNFAPISFNGKFYKRSGSSTIELNGSNLTNFLLKKYGKTWDDVIEDLFRKLNLYDGQYLKRAAVLLFAKNPQQYYIQSHSKIGKFLSETEVQSSDIIEGNLIDQVDTIMDILRLKYLKAYISYDGVHRREKLEYPYEALREAIINALIHRDYSNSSNLQIKVYTDKLIIFNGATLSVEVPIEKFIIPHQSKPYNPVMASVFYKCGFIENWGRGTLSIVNDCKKYGLPKPTFEYEWGAVKVSFFKSRVSEGVSELFSLIRINPNKRSKFFATQMKTSVKNIERWLKKLKEEDKIEFRGASKTGGYFAK